MMNQIKKMENGTFQATFADGTTKLYNELIAVDFDGEANASYNNSQMGIAIDGITLNAAVDAASQAVILDKLNAGAAEGVLYINAADAAELPKASYSTIYVGDTDAFAAYGNFAGIAETTGDFAAATKGDNAFVLTGADFSTDALAATIAHEAGHLMGTVEHDYANDGLTLDDFCVNDFYLSQGTTHFSWNGSGWDHTISAEFVHDGSTTLTRPSPAPTLTVQAMGGLHWGYAGATIRTTNANSTITPEGCTATMCIAEGNHWAASGSDGYYGGVFGVGSAVQHTADVTESGSLYLDHTYFKNNSTTYGGAVAARGQGTVLEVTNCYFTGNTATYGGAVFLDHMRHDVTIENTIFNGNTATGTSEALLTGGGALCMFMTAKTDNNYTVTVKDCQFLTEMDTIGINAWKGFLKFSGTITLNAQISNVNYFGANYTCTVTTDADTVISTNCANWSSVINAGANSRLNFTANSNVSVDLSSFATIGIAGGKSVTTTVNQNLANKSIVFDSSATNRQVGCGLKLISKQGSAALNNWNTAKLKYSDSGNELTIQNVGYACDCDNGYYDGYTICFVQGIKSLLEDNEKEVSFDATLSPYAGTINVNSTLGGAKDITGNGTSATALSGKIYADGKSLEMSELRYTGIIYGGNTYTSTETVVSNAIDLAFSNMTFADGNSNRIYGGGYVSGGNVLLSGATVTMSDVTLGKDMSIYGGGVLAAGSLNTGNIALTLDTTASSAGHSGNVYAGVYDNTAATGSGITLGTVSTTITSGSYNLVGNGSRITKASSTQGTSTLNISGGTFASYVYGGAFNYGSNATATVSGDVNFTISGGTFNELVFGGCAAQSSENAANTTITGNVNLTINATGNIVFNKTVYAGSEGYGQITGNVNVTFTGTADNITWSSKSIAISGGNQYTTGKISGRILNFGDASNGFSGNFSGKIQNRFDSMVLTNNSDITFTSKTILDSISNWTIGADCSLKWTDSNGSCDFAGDTLNITDAVLEAGTYDLFDLGSAGSLTGWGDGMTVKFGGTDATATAPGVYTGTLGGHSCTLSMDSTNNKIQLAIA